nr:outer membrane protein - Chlamydia trachomatis (serotype L1) (fragments) [Chlamydia trachomatis]
DVNKEFQMGAKPTATTGNAAAPSTCTARENPAYGRHMQNLVGLFGDNENQSTVKKDAFVPNMSFDQSVVELYTGYVGKEFPLDLTAGTDAATGTKAQPKLATAIFDTTTLNPTIAGAGEVKANAEGQLGDTMQ